MIPKRYLIATLFIAAMLVLLAIVQAPRSKAHGGVGPGEPLPSLILESFHIIADSSFQNGWTPRFLDNFDPDQLKPWPPTGGFGLPWEPASPFLEDQGFALNGPNGKGEIRLWRGLEWKRLSFYSSIVSARLDPAKGNKLLLTLKRGQGLYTTQLLELPEARVLWSINSGPWSRFSWDGKGVLLGLPSPSMKNVWLLSTLPIDSDIPKTTLAPWGESRMPAPPKNWITKEEGLWDEGKDLPGPRLLIPLPSGSRYWFPRQDRLWVAEENTWTLWSLDDGQWKRLAHGLGQVLAHPPLAMARISRGKNDLVERSLSRPDKAEWSPLKPQAPEWPEYDAAWSWKDEDTAITAWDFRFGKAAQSLPKERQREALVKNFRPDWLAAARLRRSIKSILSDGPEVGLRELEGIAWVWVGDRVIMVRLNAEDRLRKIRSLIKAK